MSGIAFEVIRPGALTTIQDLGRTGHQSKGLSICGAMDRFAAAVANVLVGNSPEAAVIEVTIIGPELVARSNSTIAIAGADLSMTVGTRRVASWSSIDVTSGETISFGARTRGARAYLAVTGGIDVPPVLGSRSTDIKAQLGGYHGRQLKAGDVLSALDKNRAHNFGGRSLLEKDIKFFRPDDGPIRIMRTHDERYGELVDNLLSQSYRVGLSSDRMGFRLDGPKLHIESDDPNEQWSEPVTAGVIQVPPDGTPIVLMSDCQTVGGYPKIGTVATVDIGRLAQLAASEMVTFTDRTLDKAQTLLTQQQHFIHVLGLANR